MGEADRSDEGIRPVRRALVSVSDKAGLDALATVLGEIKAVVLSTGGTARALRGFGLEVVDVAAATGAPEMLGGRVKTLHPVVHGGLLARRDDPDHLSALAAAGGAPIDLLAVNLYPFEATVAAGAGPDEAIEQIDIGGPAMIRAAAKNHADVAVVTDPADYEAVAQALRTAGGLDLATRRRLAAKAFARTAAYDAEVARWFAAREADARPERLTITATRRHVPPYGENPHQAAALYVLPGAPRPGAATARQTQGKPLSYNNIADADAAFELVSELARFDRPGAAIIKHANPCGAATADDLTTAYRRARLCDPVSAFGGVVAVNRPLDAATAEAVVEIFTEVVIAPGVTEGAFPILAQKPNIRVLDTGALADPAAGGQKFVHVAGGLLAQERDARLIDASDLTVATKRAPTSAELQDLLFAWTVAKHVKSNAIVFAKDRATVGVGAGQMSRLDSTRIAARKAEDMATEGGPSPIQNSVVASDAFFPFPDGLLAAAEAGATCVIQPGGSVRDAEVIAAADAAGLAMVLTGVRHFRH